MKDLVTRSGLSRDTIHFYIAEGLLPPPVRKSRNMAWYDEVHLDRLRYIQKLKEERFLPLKAIKAVLEENPGGDDSLPFTADQRRLITNLKKQFDQYPNASAMEREPELADRVCARIGLSPTDLALLAERDVITLNRDGDRVMLSSDDVLILEGLARIRQVVQRPDGAWWPEDWEMLDKLAAQLVDEEIAVFTSRFTDLDPNSIWETVNEVIPMINGVFGILHMKHIRKFVDAIAPALESDADEQD